MCMLFGMHIKRYIYEIIIKNNVKSCKWNKNGKQTVIAVFWFIRDKIPARTPKKNMVSNLKETESKSKKALESEKISSGSSGLIWEM